MSENELNNVRKLATIAIIEEIKEIPGAENIQHARVRGWWVVVKRNEFKVGDLCVYAEVDSVFPDGLDPELALQWKEYQKEMSKAATDEDKNRIREAMEEISKKNTRPEFEFLRGSKFRIKTKRIFGEISQGICFPINIISDEWQSLLVVQHPEGNIGTDVTDILGVTQYVPPDPAIMGGDAKGDMQNIGLLISDEERLENLYGKYERLKEFTYYKTEKLEGTSFTAYIKNGVFGVTGRTIEFKVPPEDADINTLNVYWKIAKKLDLEYKLRMTSAELYCDGLYNFAIQGELVGEGIQGNIYKLKGQKVYFYNAFDIDAQEFLAYDVFVKMMQSMELETVPILNDNFKLPEKAIELLEEADKTYQF